MQARRHGMKSISNLFPKYTAHNPIPGQKFFSKHESKKMDYFFHQQKLREFIQLACTISTFKRTSNIRNDT
jgi:hypothetical protein